MNEIVATYHDFGTVLADLKNVYIKNFSQIQISLHYPKGVGGARKL